MNTPHAAESRPITPDLTLPKLLLETAQRYGDGKVAMREKEFGIWRPITWRRYRDEVQHLAVGFGAGFIPFYGDGFESFTRGILTPISVIYGPSKSGPSPSGNLWKKAFIIRVESSYIMQGFTHSDFGNTTSRYTTNGGEWNFSIATGFDFRRVH